MKLLLDDKATRGYNLNANEACIFAAVLKCTRAGRGWYGNYRELAAAMPFVMSHETARRAVQKLLNLGLIERREKKLYAVTQIVTDDAQNVTEPTQNVTSDAQNVLPPNNPPINIYNYILSLTQTRTPAYEKVVSWITDDEEKLQMLFYRSGIITEALQGEKLAKIAAPYIEAYFNAMEFATDWEMKGRRDTKAHFNNWLRTHKVLNDGKQESTVHANAGRSTPKTNERATPDYDAEF